MHELTGIALVIIFVFVALALAVAGMVNVVRACRRLIGHLLEWQHSP
jgi:hypothetical protein